MMSPRPLCAKTATVTLTLALLLGGCGSAPMRPAAEEKPQPAVENKAAPATGTKAEPEIDPRTLSDYNMAVNTYKAGNRKTAESIFLNLSKAHPEYPGPLANLGMIHYDKGEFDKAEEYFNQALALKPDLPEIYNLRGIMHRNKGEFDKARESYEAGLKIAPENPNLILNLGILYDLYLNEPQKALQLLADYKKVAGDDKEVNMWIADITKRMTTK